MSEMFSVFLMQAGVIGRPYPDIFAAEEKGSPGF
jgi:hypothetical protein